MYSYRIEQAIRAAAVLHKDQIRRGQTGLPYVTHLYAVAFLLADYTDDEDIIIGALLHDTLEDTSYSVEELEQDFGPRVRGLVEGVTEPEIDSDDRADNWRKRKAGYLEGLTNASAGSLLISAADKIHNMRSIVEEYTNRHQAFLDDFGGSIDDRLRIYQEISDLLNEKLQNDILAEFNHVFNEYKEFVTHVKETENL